MSTEALVSFKVWQDDLAHTHCGSNIDKSDFYLLREHLNAIKSLSNNDDEIISQLDNGAGESNTQQTWLYKKKKKMVDILNDTSTVTILSSVDEFDKTAKQEQGIQRELFGFYNEHQIPTNIYEITRLVGSQRPQLYRLPKINKHNTPLRPILFMISTA